MAGTIILDGRRVASDVEFHIEKYWRQALFQIHDLIGDYNYASRDISNWSLLLFLFPIS